MRLLYITAYCDPNHPYAPHVFAWAREMARHCEHIDLIALQASGQPAGNVSVHSLGQDLGRGRAERRWRFFRLLSRLVPRCDVVFCQFSPSFALGAWPFARLHGKPSVLWYAHGAVPRRLRLAERVVDKILTSSADGCRLESAKVVVVGQGIDTDAFVPAPQVRRRPLTVLSVGRLSPIKRFQDLIAAAEILARSGQDAQIRVRIVGTPPNDAARRYAEELRQQVSKVHLSRVVEFAGPVRYADMPACYQDADVMVNLSETGSMDKVVLEAMSCGLVVLSTNEAYAGLLGRYDPRLVLEKRDVPLLAERLRWLRGVPPSERSALGCRLRQAVVAGHSLDRLARRMVREIEELVQPAADRGDK